MAHSAPPPDSKGPEDLQARPGESEAITRLLHRAALEGKEALQAVLPLVYQNLRAMAEAKMRALPPGATLQATALVHEAYLRLSERQPENWEGRKHLFFAASRAMRDILVEDARKKQALKRGGGKARLSLDELPLALEAPSEDLLALDEALQELEQDDPEGYAIVTLRFYGGLGMKEIAELQGTPLRTVERRWRFLRAWLADHLHS